MAGQDQRHPARSSLTRKQLGELLDTAAEVMTEALGQGGTSFDSMYVNVNGESGYFERRWTPTAARVSRAGARDAAEFHEPLVVLLSEMPTPPAGPPH